MRMPVAVFALIFAALFGPAQAMEFIETPSLEPLVKEGKLPPVAERVPAEPYISRLEESGREIGRHGGTLNTLMARSKDVRLMVVYGYARLVKFNRKLELEVQVEFPVEAELVHFQSAFLPLTSLRLHQYTSVPCAVGTQGMGLA